MMGDRLIRGALLSDVFGDSIVPLTVVIAGEEKTIGYVSVKADTKTMEAVVEDEESLRLILGGKIAGISLDPGSEALVDFRQPDEAEDSVRVLRLKLGNRQFGHSGEHHGNGTEDCPEHLHHHCDEFCEQPSEEELKAAGINPATFKINSRS